MLPLLTRFCRAILPHRPLADQIAARVCGRTAPPNQAGVATGSDHWVDVVASAVAETSAADRLDHGVAIARHPVYSLPHDVRVVLALRVVLGVGVASAAEVLDVDVDQVRRRQSHALALLRRHTG